MSRLVSAVSLWALLLSACATANVPAPAGTPRRPLGPNDTEYTIRHDTVIRTYVLHVPPGLESKADLPVVVMLWDNGSADGAVSQSGWSQKADAEGFVVAYGQADRGVWNDGSAAGLAGRVKNGDVGYVGAILDDTGRHVKVDGARLFVAGFGNGGSLAWLSTAEAAHRIAAGAALGGHLYPDTMNIARGSSFLYAVGSADAQYPLDGGRAVDGAGNPELRPPLQQTIDKWLAAMKCSLTAVRLPDADGAKVFSYRGCRDGTETMVRTITGMGHAWPGARVGGNAAPGLSAVDLFWDFFRSHSRA